MSPLAVPRQIGGTRSSAVCAFSLKDIKRVFEGKYKELNKETSRWTTYGVPEISPRPGSVSTTPNTEQHSAPTDTHIPHISEYLSRHNKCPVNVSAPCPSQSCLLRYTCAPVAHIPRVSSPSCTQRSPPPLSACQVPGCITGETRAWAGRGLPGQLLLHFLLNFCISIRVAYDHHLQNPTDLRS